MSSEQENHWDSLASDLSGEEPAKEDNASRDENSDPTEVDQSNSVSETSTDVPEMGSADDEPKESVGGEGPLSGDLDSSNETASSELDDVVVDEGEPVKSEPQESGFGLGLFEEDELSEIRAENDKDIREKAKAKAVEQADRETKREKKELEGTSKTDRPEPKSEVIDEQSADPSTEISVEDAKGVIENLDSTGDDVAAALDRLFAPVEIGGALDDTRDEEVVFESEEVDDSLEFEESKDKESESVNEEEFSYTDLEGDPVQDTVVPDAEETEEEAEAGQIEEEVVAPAAGSEKPAEKSRRRKRRIWPWSRKQVEEDEPTKETSDVARVADTNKIVEEAPQKDSEASESDEGEKKERSGRRRRGRRRGKGGQSRSNNGSDGENKESDSRSVETTESNDETREKKSNRGNRRGGGGRANQRGSRDSDQTDEAQDFEEKSEQTEEKPKRRRGNIPTWDTAVSYVVDKNVKARGKSIPKRERIKKKGRKNTSRDEEPERDGKPEPEESRDNRRSDNKGSGQSGDKDGNRKRSRRGKGRSRKTKDREVSSEANDTSKDTRDASVAGDKNEKRETGRDGSKKRRRRRNSGRNDKKDDNARAESSEPKVDINHSENNGETSADKKPNRRRRRRRARTDADE